MMKLSACDCNRGPSIIWTIKPLWNDIWATSFGVWPVSGIQKYEVRHIDFVSTKNRKVFKNTEIQFATYDIPFFDICKLQMQHNSDDASSAVGGWPTSDKENIYKFTSGTFTPSSAQPSSHTAALSIKINISTIKLEIFPAWLLPGCRMSRQRHGIYWSCPRDFFHNAGMDVKLEHLCKKSIT